MDTLYSQKEVKPELSGQVTAAAQRAIVLPWTKAFESSYQVSVYERFWISFNSMLVFVFELEILEMCSLFSYWGHISMPLHIYIKRYLLSSLKREDEGSKMDYPFLIEFEIPDILVWFDTGETNLFHFCYKKSMALCWVVSLSLAKRKKGVQLPFSISVCLAKQREAEKEPGVITRPRTTMTVGSKVGVVKK